MADLQVGNIHGVTTVGSATGFIANVTADGINTVTLDSVKGLSAGDRIDIIDPATGAVLASNRLVTNITNAGVVTYDGADVAATTAHDVFFTGTFTSSSRSNINGGNNDQTGYVDTDMLTISSAKARLTAINSTLYTADLLNQMTWNDMIYAIRLADSPGTIK